MKKSKSRKHRRIFILFILIIILMIIFIGRNYKKEKETSEEVVDTLSTNTVKNVKNENNSIIENTPKIDSKTADWNLILVNKENKIPEDYQLELSTIEYGYKVDKRIAENLTQMLNDARKEGLNPWICSSYRTNKTQKKLFNNKVNKYMNEGYGRQEAEEKASYWVAYPGTSEHETGLAVDIVSKDYQILDEKQEKTAVQKWLTDHCTDYGFVLRYPTDKKEITKINYEPWHYRYVGEENSKFMKEKGFCLEEYVEYIEDMNK